MPPSPDLAPKTATPPDVDPAAKKRIDEINAELGKIEGESKKVTEELAVAIAASPAAKQAAADQLKARADALLAERASLTPPPPPDPKERDAALKTLRDSGWTDNLDGTWTCTRPFKYGDNVHVGSGVRRPAGEAAGIEAQRPKA
jgi:hypothetical protein